MKLPEKLAFGQRVRLGKRGVALVTVLTVMALTTILILTFFSLATSEHRASDTYSKGIQAQQVAEQAVNMVIAQIREATTVGVDKAWASQPGAIRRWKSSGSVDHIYKLYSDDRMKVTDPKEMQTDFGELRDWNDKPAHFVDLNEPVIRGEKVYYPIVSPTASNMPEWPKELDGDQDGVEGFSYDATLVPQGAFGQKAAAVAEARDGHVAMPVRWLYQLADGTIGILSEGGGDDSIPFVPISGSGEPSEKNQIVSRFAFWADDESSKLNINVHAGGLAWDIPKAGGEMDMDMGRYQPAQKEWQRYPGHPATTHLSPALAPGVLDIVRNKIAMELLYGVVPRVVGGGSEAGTRKINTFDPAEANGLIPDTEPLFPSLDDMIMRSDRTPHRYPDSTGGFVPPEELSEYLERSKFFVTAYSRAPEVNVFNRPRVAMWPIYDTEKSADPSSDYQQKLTPFDRLIHYCASVGGADSDDPFDYIFRRKHADHPRYDYDSIRRNREIYAYLDDAMNRVVPGFGGHFAAKYGKAEQEQILTQIFDYIRIANLHDDSLYGEDFQRAFQDENTDDHWTYTNPRNNRNKSVGLKGHGQVVPIRIKDSKGFGRFYSLASAQVVAIAAALPGQLGYYAEGRYPGLTEDKRSGPNEVVHPPEGEVFLNIPPWKRRDGAAGAIGDADWESQWPDWLVNLKKGTDPVAVPGELEAAFIRSNWNWQLAYLDSDYRRAVLANPTNAKFSLAALGPDSLTDKTRLKDGEQLVQGAFLFNLFCPAIGWNSINPDMEIEITPSGSFNFTGVDGSVPFLGFMNNSGVGSDGFGTGNETYLWATNWADSAWGGRRYGGLMPFEFMINAPGDVINKATPYAGGGYSAYGGQGRLTPLDRGYDKLEGALGSVNRDIVNDASDVVKAYRYDLVTVPFKITAGNLAFTGGEVEFQFYPGRDSAEGSRPTLASTDVVQTITLDFDGFNVDSPGKPGFYSGWRNEFGNFARDSFNPLERNSLTIDPGNPDVISNAHKAGVREGRSASRGVGRMGQISLHRRPNLFGRNDVIQSVEITHGDARLVAAQDVIGATDTYFDEHRNYDNQRMAHSMTSGTGGPYPGAAVQKDYLIIPTLQKGYRGKNPLPFGVKKSTEVQWYGDFDNGNGLMIDGPYINKPDEGNTHSLKTKFQKELTDSWELRRDYGEFPYFNREWRFESGGPAYFSPNRIISGPGMFGSLPTGVEADKPWQTLLFRPNVVGNGFRTHPGAGASQGGQDPPDHIIMDLFWMPVVEPYAISEPLSTAGKVNINYEMVPFLHIDRSTALRGVLRSEYMLCVPNEWSNSYKHNSGRGRGYHWKWRPNDGELQGKRLRKAIVESKTLDQLKDRFNDGLDMYKVATEFCEVHLIGEEVTDRMDYKSNKGRINSYTPTAQQMENGSYWKDHLLVGDNSKERPYANIVQRLTTKSNTFKVHFRAQVVKQARRDSDADYGTWRPELDTVQAEYRGSSIVERFVDPNDPNLPDFATEPSEVVDEFYQYRIVNPRRFAP